MDAACNEAGARSERLVGETEPSEFRAGPPVIASFSDVGGADGEAGEGVWNSQIRMLKRSQ